MVLGFFEGNPESLLPPGPTKVPEYFPVEPKGCEKVSQDLFTCLAGPATEKARDMEKAGVHQSYFEGVTPKPESENAAKVAAESDDPDMPKVGDNPLDLCRSNIGLYMQCCNRELKKKKNWMLTEPYRVQEEYRYSGKKDESVGAK